jgi:cytochrome b561
MERSVRGESWSPLAKAAHWLAAALVLSLFVLAWIFIWLQASPLKVLLVTLHQSAGAIVFLLGIFRILARIDGGFPALPESVRRPERFLARLVQVALYAALIVVPLSGWLFANASGEAASFLGLFDLPHLWGKDIPVRDFVWTFHKDGQYVVLMLLGLHIAGALRHHFLERDDVLRRMLPGGAARPEQAAPAPARQRA